MSIHPEQFTTNDTLGTACATQPAGFRTTSSPPIVELSEPMKDTGQRGLSSSSVTLESVTSLHCSFRPSIHSGPFGHSAYGHGAEDTFTKTAS